MKSRYIHIFFIAFIINSFSSCIIPLNKVLSRYGLASTEPNKDEITGVWVTDENTLKDIRESGKYVVNTYPKFIFQNDGNFRMENMPDWWKDGFGESRGGFETNSGKWKLSKRNCCWQIDLHFDSPNLYTNVGLLEHRFDGEPKYLIEVILGDPDSGNEMIFLKQ